MSAEVERIDVAEENIGTRTRQAFFWLVGARLVGQLASFVITAVLARLLSPSEFGLIGMVTVFTNFLMLFKDFGTGMSVVQAIDLDQEQLSSVFWFNLGVGLVLAAATFLISPVVAIFYGKSEIMPLLAVMSLNFPLRSLGVMHDSISRRRLDFDRLSIFTLVTTIVAGLAGIVTAWMGLGVWALVAQSVVQTFSYSVLLWFTSSWRPAFHFAKSDIRHLSGFMFNLVGFNTVNYFSRNADSLLIGRFLGSEPLGLYSLAYRLMLYPVHSLAGLASKALFPAFAQLQTRDDRMSGAYVKTIRYLSMLIFPLMAGLSITAHEVVLLMYGVEWLGAVPALRWLAIVGAFHPVMTLYASVILAKGYADWLFRWSIFHAFVTISGFVVGMRWGIEGIALGYLFTQSLLMVVGLPLMFKKCNTSSLRVLKALRNPLLATFVMILVLLAFRFSVQSYDILLPIFLLLNVLIGVAVYVTMLFAFEGGTLIHALRQEILVTLNKVPQ